MKTYKERFIVIAFVQEDNPDEIKSFIASAYPGYTYTVSSYEDARKYHTYEEANETLQILKKSHPSNSMKLVRLVRSFEGVSKSNFNS